MKSKDILKTKHQLYGLEEQEVFDISEMLSAIDVMPCSTYDVYKYQASPNEMPLPVALYLTAKTLRRHSTRFIQNYEQGFDDLEEDSEQPLYKRLPYASVLKHAYAREYQLDSKSAQVSNWLKETTSKLYFSMVKVMSHAHNMDKVH